ncbi:MAG: ATPase, T2SS/T4P/T4SS family [Planctomycetota bacterium]
MRAPVPARSPRTRGLLLVPFLVLGVLARAPLPAQPGTGGQDTPSPRITVEGDKVIFAMDEREGVPFLQFVKFAQKITGKVFHIDYNSAPELDPRMQAAGAAGQAQQHTIQLIGNLVIDKSEFFDFFQTLLFIKDWAIVPRGGDTPQFYDLIKKSGRRANDIKKGVVFVNESELEKYRNQTGVYILTTVKLQYVDSNLAATTLRGNFSDQQGLDQLIAIAGSPTMMITGFGPSVYTLYQLLKIVDTKVESPSAELRVINLEHASAEDLEPILSELLNTQRAPQRPQGQVSPEEQVPVKLMADPTTPRRLIVYAHKDKIREIENMVVQLDVAQDLEVDSNYQIIRLRNTLAKDIREKVSQFVTQSTTQQRQAQQGGGAPGGAQARREPTPVIIDDEKSNSLLVSATKTQFQRIKDLIFKLDVRQPQVLIETALVELGTQDIEKIGVELGLLKLPTEGSNDRNPFGFTSFGLTSFQDTDGDSLPDTRLPDFENPLSGLTGGIISGKDFELPVLVNLLKSNSTANVLSIPSVLVNNNENAYVTSKESFPTQTQNQGTATTTTTFGGFQDAGIDLKISPSISEGNHLKINLSLEVSKFTGQFDSNSQVPPPKTIRTISTVVTMPTGHTMILGGVIEDQSSDVDDGIPFLKDIPLLGFLFRSQEKTNRKTNLYFFLTPHILDEDDFSDLEELTFRKKLEAAQSTSATAGSGSSTGPGRARSPSGSRTASRPSRTWTGSAGSTSPTTIARPGASTTGRRTTCRRPRSSRSATRRSDAGRAPGPAPRTETDMRDRLKETLLAKAGLTPDKVRDVLDIEQESGQSIDRILPGRGFLSERDTLGFLADYLGLEHRENLLGVKVPPDFIHKVPVQFARTYNLCALSESGASFEVATFAPLDVQPLDDLAGLLGREVVPVLAPKQEITNLINRAYRHKADGVDEALTDIREEDIMGVANQIEESEDLLDVANKAPIIRLVNMLLFQALKVRASDIHLQPYEDRLQVRMRIDGILYDMEAIPKKAQDAITSRVKVMGKMDIAERRLPQDGRASVRIGDGDVDIRISTIPVANGERIVFRILDKTAKVYRLEEIGLTKANYETIRHYIEYSHGMIFVTGPTGSGKTTTLYAALSEMDHVHKNILTIEDPIEYNLDGISQVQVNTKKGLTFAAGLRSFLRQDPDVMMVGEVRDQETAEIAIRAALTGHLVFSTVHTNDSASTVTRLLDIDIEPYLVASSLLMVIAQRLVRTICPTCKTLVVPEKRLLTQLEDLMLSPDELPDGKLAMGMGCDDCFGSGFQGRTAIYEIMPIDSHVQKQIVERASATEIKRGAMERGLVTLRMDGVDKIRTAETTPQEVLRVTQLDVA